MSASVGARWDCDTIVYVCADETGEYMFQTHVLMMQRHGALMVLMSFW